MWDGLAVWTIPLAGLGLTWLVQSTVLLVLGLLAGQLLRHLGPAVLSGIYRTTLAAILVCPIASAGLMGAGFDRLSLRLQSSATEPEVERKPAAVPQPVVLSVGEPAARGLALDRDEPSFGPAPTKGMEPPRSAATMRTATVPTLRLTLAGAAAVGLAVWGFGATVLGLRLGGGLIRMRRLRVSAVPAEPEVETLCREVARRLNVEAPTVWRSPFLFSPCLDGLRRPAIFLPDDIDEGLVDILVHEMAHLVRRDGVWNLLRRSAAVLLWVQPLFWVLTRRLEAAAEDVCDDYVVQFGADPARYAGRLLELAGRALPPVAPAGVGMVSLRSMLARRIVRILDTSRTLSIRAGTRAVMVMLSVGLVGTVLAGLLGVAGGERRAKAQTPNQAAEAKSKPDDKIIRGQVVDPNGQPVAGATVIASRSRAIRDGIRDHGRANRQSEQVRKNTDPTGRYAVSFETSQRDSEDPTMGRDVQVLATAPGFGLGFLMDGKLITLRAGDQPINGRVVDLEGRPVAGVHVRLGWVGVPAPGVAEGAVSSEKPWSLVGRLILDAAPLLPDGLVTGADGRFRIDGLGHDVLADLTLSGPSVAYKRVKVVTRAIEPIADNSRDADSGRLDDPVTYGADCTIALEPTRPIEGVVRDAQSKEPIPGAIVTAAALSGHSLVIDGSISTETDAQGHYRLIGLPKERGKWHELAVYPPLDRPYFITSDLEVLAQPGLDSVTRDIDLKRGTWVTGKVTDIKTSKPVDAVVDYFPFLTNPFAKDYPNFDPATMSSVRVKTRYRTDREGRFRTVVLPGRGVVTARVDLGPYRPGFGAESIAGRTKGGDQLLTYDHIYPSLYHGIREIDVPEGSASFTCDVPLDPGGNRKLRLIDRSEMPVTDAKVIRRLPDSVDFDHSVRAESVITIRGLEPAKPRTVVIQHAARKLGAILTVPTVGSEDGDETTVTLHQNATVMGRFVDEKRKPFIGHIQVGLLPAVVSLHDEIPIADVTLDADGRFHCEDLPPGGPYRIWVVNKEGSYARVKRKPEEFAPFELSRDLKVEPGQVVDFGTYNVDTGKPIEPPLAKSAHADVPIHGRIVDLEGRPVAGVSIKLGDVQGPKSGDLTAWIKAVGNGEPPWIAYRQLGDDVKVAESVKRETTTDVDGRFRFEGVGGERVVELMIRGETVAYTTINVVTRITAPFPARGYPDHHGPGSQTIYGADFTFTTAPSRPIEGVVRDAKTKQPMAGVLVESHRFAGSDYVHIRPLKSVTDERGRFRIVGMPKGKGNFVLAVPNDDQPYFMRKVAVGDPPGIAPVPVEIELHRGVIITGKITDKATGKPVAGAWLHYLPFLENAYVQALPEFDKDGNVDGDQRRYTTKADGIYRLVGMPGRAIVGVEGGGRTGYRSGAGAESIAGLEKNGHYKTWNNPIQPSRSWPNTLVEINPAEGMEELTLDAQLDPGQSLQIKVVDSEGNPVADASVEQRTQLPLRSKTPDALFELANFRPDEVRVVVIRHDGRALGKVVRLRAGDDAKGPVVVTLAPMASIKGRTVDADGNPIPAARVRVDLEMTDTFLHPLTNVSSGRDGRFEVLNVPTGCKYGLLIESGTMIKDRRTASSRAVVKPGETTDVGNIAFEND